MNQHDRSCATYSLRRCDCHHSNRLSTSFRVKVNDRIKHLASELDELHRLIGQAVATDKEYDDFLVQANIVQARIDEVKNVRAMLDA